MADVQTADSTERSPQLMAAVRDKLGATPPPAPEVDAPETPEPDEVVGEIGGPGVTEAPPVVPEGAEDAPTDTPEATAPEGFSVTMPTANADGSKGPAGAGELVLDGLPQEHADTLKYHLKRSARLTTVEKQVSEVRERAGIGDFFTKQPLHAMELVAKEKPELAQQFVERWGKANWRQLAELVGKLGLGNTDERILDAEATVARRDAADAIQKGYQDLTYAARAQDYVQGVDDTVQGVLEPLRLSADDKRDLELLIGNRISEVHAQRKQAGRDPFLQPSEVLETIQPIVARYASRTVAAPTPGKPAAPTTPAKPGPALSADELARRAKQADDLRKANGKPNGARPSRVGKIKSTGRPLADALARLRAAN